MNKKSLHFKQCSTVTSFLLLCLFISEPSISQQANFRHLTIDDGLSQNAVSSMLQDSRGFMWFGISVQFVRELCVRGMSAKSYNPDEERGAVKGLWLSFTNEIIKAHWAKSP